MCTFLVTLYLLSNVYILPQCLHFCVIFTFNLDVYISAKCLPMFTFTPTLMFTFTLMFNFIFLLFVLINILSYTEYIYI